MRILYLITKGEVGGAGVHVLDLCVGMKNLGHEVALMCPSPSFLAEEFQKGNKNFYPNNYFANTLNPLKVLSASVAISRAIRNFHPDIIACHSSMAGVLGRMVALFHKKPRTVFTAHSWAFTEGSSLFRKFLMIPVEKCLAKFTGMIIAVSFFDKSIALKYKITKNEKIKVIHNGVPDRDIRNLNKKENLKIITVTRLDYPKLPLLLIEVFALVNKTNPDTELVIVGYGTKINQIHSLINNLGVESKVRVLNTIKKEDVIEELKQADIFTLISKHEGLPLTILEAMSVGLPVVASDVGGIGEEVDEDNGILVGNNVLEIKEALLKMISSEDQRIYMSKNSWNKQRELFSINKFIKETEKVYQELISN